MKRNPLIPFAIIAVLGIVLMISMSGWGSHAAHERAAKEKGASTQQKANASSQSPEDIFKQNCATCHGQNLEGGMGPNLKTIGSKWSKDKILNQIKNGGGSMPGGIIQGQEADKVAEWLSKKK
ncbi:cytochrome c550 [Camelliibacillus cellulosilyticus]|uniref:Cytochrome c550 n=1 Tax=Camelliibacillus cellulosilyticus TaxID=2174486 RepID=A0ABV9GM68_9BACL